MTPIANARRDLFEAMKQIADTGYGPKEQLPSMGCVRSNGIIEMCLVERIRWGCRTSAVGAEISSISFSRPKK
jgi:hypothetical protein